MSNTKKLSISFSNDQIKQYILNSIDLEGYEQKNSIENLYEIFKSEYLNKYNLNYYKTEKNCFKNWLMGLPSSINIVYYYVDIINKAKELNIIPINASEEEKEEICRRWFNIITDNFYQLLNLTTIKA